MLRFLLISIFCLVAWPTFSHALTGNVINIADGDTITILDSSKKLHKIRLYGIDCPESGQPFGNGAKKLTAKLAARKTATVCRYGTDRYGRTVGVVYIGSVNVNESLIKTGYEWQYQEIL
jgi:micrococcal nuclease